MKKVTFTVSTGKKGQPDYAEGTFEHDSPESYDELEALVSPAKAFEYAYAGWRIAVQAEDRATLQGKEVGVMGIGRAVKEALAKDWLSPEARAEIEKILGKPLA
jgi:hypothetical protein